MPDHSRTHRWLAVLAAALGAFAIVAGEPYPAGRDPATMREGSFATAVDVARWVRNGQPDFRLVDVRDDSLFDAYHIPGAERIALDELSRRAWGRDETVVVYAEDDGKATRAARTLRSRGVANTRVLRGGLLSWVDSIVAPHLAPLAASATPAEQAARHEQLELSRYFGGTPIVSPTAGTGQRARDPDTGGARRSEAAAVARVLRRGC
jgi:rhodanese-related sulfurtransferase